MINIQGKEFHVTGRVIRTLRLADEWLGLIEDPESVMAVVDNFKSKVDLFSFRQSPLETERLYEYPMEWEDLAVISITTHQFWLSKQISSGAKRAVKKAQKKGVEIKVVDFSDDLVKGITAIFNETPVRQGRPYCHFRKSFDAVKTQLSNDIGKCDFIGAYLGDELIGFIQLGIGKGYAVPFGMVSKLEHRDKSPQNALLSKAVEICEQRELQYILYGFWSRGGLGEFKRHNGCIKRPVPRYYIPLSFKGKISIKICFHRGVSHLIPTKLADRLIEVRSRLYSKKFSG